jgi:(+)-trans-carveol dehydrogenase
MGRVEGKVALITGAARGQGRAIARRLAEEGADIIALDVCAQIEPMTYPLAERGDLDETVRLVEEVDRRIIAREADVRDLTALRGVVQDGLAEFGQIDVVCANAGIASYAPALEISEDHWQTVLDVNLTGVWKTVVAAVPPMVERGQGGSVMLTSSVAGLTAYPLLAHYTAAKHGVTGLMRNLAIELAPHSIRVNTIHPGNVDTPMINNSVMFEHLLGDPNASREDAAAAFKPMNALPVSWLDATDIANTALWLASDEARYVTGTTQVVDAGSMAPFKIPHA